MTTTCQPPVTGASSPARRCYAEEQPLFDEIFYWAPTQAKQLEVDFLLRRGRELLAIEVKTGRRFHAGMLTGLSAIRDLQHVRRRVLVYGATRRLRTADGVEVWPLDTFLEALASNRLWP